MQLWEPICVSQVLPGDDIGLKRVDARLDLLRGRQLGDDKSILEDLFLLGLVEFGDEGEVFLRGVLVAGEAVLGFREVLIHADSYTDYLGAVAAR